ncbi:ribonuclease T2 [Methylocella sp. CPCC 101449]|jgi:ribonuclease T2|uniref:ribonuclease T2 n=1 Tax=Methylocella sp. CPCC 101449 TaxID=2987531 RepID=UPI00288C74C0|nr:ribonuclease T2 [Methylocella sp. CPCC 101449]MDT2022976.1 ribonuclease T2 [Methylocella sp. CPCC 101449]HEV2570375.1 ribonuclease T2 [Beijerinckiaceae bacterium]
MPIRSLLILLLAVFSLPAVAQYRGGNNDCVLDRCEDRQGNSDRNQDRRQPSNRDDRSQDNNRGGWFGGPRRDQATSVAPGPFDFYVLALSWSSSFCASGNNDDRDQCQIGSNHGFVVHGLWPQYERGFPSDCPSPIRNPPASAMRDAEGVFPDLGLARYEWRKHGTCSGRSPSEYFADVRRARNKVEIPQELQQPRSAQRVSPLDIQRAFIDANRGLRPGMMAVACQRGMLQEVRICLSKDLRDFRPCPEVTRQACRSQQINVPPVR